MLGHELMNWPCPDEAGPMNHDANYSEFVFLQANPNQRLLSPTRWRHTLVLLGPPTHLSSVIGGVGSSWGWWMTSRVPLSLQWRHNGRNSVSNHQPHDCLLNRLFRRRSKKASKLRVTGLCAGSSPVPGEFPAQMARNAENVSIWWRHHIWWNCNVDGIHTIDNHKHSWKPRFVMMTTLSSLVASEVAVTTTSDATSHDNVGVMTILNFQCYNHSYINSQHTAVASFTNRD